MAGGVGQRALRENVAPPRRRNLHQTGIDVVHPPTAEPDAGMVVRVDVPVAVQRPVLLPLGVAAREVELLRVRPDLCPLFAAAVAGVAEAAIFK